MLAFYKRHYISAKLSRNISNIILNILIIVIFSIMGVFDGMGMWSILIWGILVIQALTSAICIFKFNIRK